jgi:hypothetical protein
MMKIALCIATAGVDSYGYIARYAQRFSEVARARGFEVEVLRHPGPDFYTRLYVNLMDPECVVHFYGYLFNLNLDNGSSDRRALSAIEVSSATTVTTIGDHPFSTFMQSTVQHAHPRMKFIIMDSAFQDEMQTINPDLSSASYDHQPISPPTNYDPEKSKKFANCDWDLVVPMFVTNMSGHGIKFVLSNLDADWFVKVVTDTYESALTTTERSPFQIFRECFHRHVGLSLEEVRDGNPKVVNQMIMTIAAVDGIIRQERRQKMVRSLLRSVGKLKVAVTCDHFAGLDVDENVQFLGKRSVADVATLMGNARAVLNCNPSYPSSLHERVVSGMMYESCVITDVNRYIEENFDADEYVSYAPSSSMTIADIYGSCDVRAVAEKGAQKVGADSAYTWNSHFDRFVHAAAA